MKNVVGSHAADTAGDYFTAACGLRRRLGLRHVWSRLVRPVRASATPARVQLCVNATYPRQSAYWPLLSED